jgi:hypothetical protein
MCASNKLQKEIGPVDRRNELKLYPICASVMALFCKSGFSRIVCNFFVTLRANELFDSVFPKFRFLLQNFGLEFVEIANAQPCPGTFANKNMVA